MARGGMRVGEVLKIRPIDVQDRKIRLPEPKSRKESEVVFIPQKVADRLKDYHSEIFGKNQRYRGFEMD
jgi:integrase